MPWSLLESTLNRYLASPSLAVGAKVKFETAVEETVRENLTFVLQNTGVSYRDVVLIQLAYAIQNPGLDTRQRPKGARGLAGRLGAFLKQHHIQAVVDAYQNIGKNTVDLVRGNEPVSDTFLTWAASAPVEQLQACFDFACSLVAATSRPVRPMPELKNGELTFGRVLHLFTTMFGIPSQGAHEQFITACLLDALVEQMGPAGYRVATKKLNTADRSAGTAGDIEVLVGSRVLEAFEVTANDWRTKVSGTREKLREHDLSRLHIVGSMAGTTYDTVANKLKELPDDLSVLDVTAFAATMTAVLTRKYRGIALGRLYDYLDRYQEQVERVNAYVQLLLDQGLAE